MLLKDSLRVLVTVAVVNNSWDRAGDLKEGARKTGLEELSGHGVAARGHVVRMPPHVMAPVT